MNERIQELAKQAEVYSSMWTGEEKQEALLEKFAELIIQECIRLGEDSQYKCRTFPVSTSIKQHFGVK
jgi:hypothetical protein